jgi:hypothetical protein
LSRRTLRWTCAGAPSTSRKYSFRSIPAENASPAPVSTTTPRLVVGVERLEHLEHLAVQRRAHRVALLRPVQLNPGDPSTTLTRTVSQRPS